MLDESKKRTRRSFTEEFKHEAVQMAKKNGNSQTARDLGIDESNIRNWIKKYENPVIPRSSQVQKPYSDLEKELKKLRKENSYLKEINRVLKKSTAIFSSEHMVDLK